MATSATETTTEATAAAPRRRRADAQRNSERLLGVAREVFAEHGPDASLEEIARRAEVGIGTLYRHYPTRQALLEAVFRDSVESSCARAEELMQTATPFDALASWLREQLEVAGACQSLGASVMITMLDEHADAPPPCEAMRVSGAALLARAQSSGDVRADTNIEDLLRLVNAVALATEDTPDGQAQADRMFTLLMDGVRPHR
jgi:AcrR family transcriptional regulator